MRKLKIRLTKGDKTVGSWSIPEEAYEEVRDYLSAYEDIDDLVLTGTVGKSVVVCVVGEEISQYLEDVAGDDEEDY